MKRKLVLLLLLLTTSFLLLDKPVSAAKKLEKKETHPLYVQQGKTYQLSKILSDITDPDEFDNLKNGLKGKKVKWSAKKSQIKLTKKTIKVKKQGEFKLTGVTKKAKYVITLVSVPEKWPAISEGVTHASIVNGNDGKMVEVKDVNMTQYLYKLLNAADYRFDYDHTNHRTVGWTYHIRFYSEDGKVERALTMASEEMLEGRKWFKPASADIHDKVSELYNRLMLEQGPAE